ncbi:PHP domain-containing protein [Catellatospora tritici]|uniref:PHP domain-containing protein n=1 Tax=Catellatospora tritici TaxID=2851566 RepID=UPI0020C575F3|nr:PHP domain-containing protein [Catellatospora tritici]
MRRDVPERGELTVLPADSHVHSEWSWDSALVGSMERTCARAVELGLPAIAFTEHVDHTVWQVPLDIVNPDDRIAVLAAPDGSLTPPVFDAAGYLASIERCRERFPDLRILSGMELGEPHLHATAAAALLSTGRFDRVLGSVHCVADGSGFTEPFALYRRHPAADVVRRYLDEVARLVRGSDLFSVLAHIDYPVRSWPMRSGPSDPYAYSMGSGSAPFDPYSFEEEFRHVLRLLADSGRALEVNTKVPLHPEIVGWWRDEGGRAVTFGSDAHVPAVLAHGFAEAVAMVEAYGFRPGRHSYDFWTRPGR